MSLAILEENDIVNFSLKTIINFWRFLTLFLTLSILAYNGFIIMVAFICGAATLAIIGLGAFKLISIFISALSKKNINNNYIFGVLLTLGLTLFNVLALTDSILFSTFVVFVVFFFAIVATAIVEKLDRNKKDKLQNITAIEKWEG